MSRSINVILNLKDQFTGPLKKATANAKATERSFKMGMNKIKKAGAGMAKTAVKGIAVWGCSIDGSNRSFFEAISRCL